jgi:hypothetical protein
MLVWSVLQGFLDASYKTTLCGSLADGTECAIGPKCQHAHSLQELRADAAVELGVLDPDYKTFFCEDFMHKGICPTLPAQPTPHA